MLCKLVCGRASKISGEQESWRQDLPNRSGGKMASIAVPHCNTWDGLVGSLTNRHLGSLEQRTFQNISGKRVDILRTIIIKCFCYLRQTLKNVLPEQIINNDETKVIDDPGKNADI